MESDKTKRKSTLQVLKGISVPVPLGKKSCGRLPRPGDPEPSALRPWLLIGGAVGAALVVGVLIGRFVLP